MSTINVGNVNTSSVNGGQLAGFRNKIINGNFALNQRGYSSASTLSSGTYAHDRWKAGASGGDYSFTQSANGCTITIAAGKTLIQVIEDANIEGGTYVLSWSGTAQARYGVDSATPSGSYADSPITITGQSASTTMSVEFDDGTLSNVQLELGSTATTFEQRGIGTELALCQRYYSKSYFLTTAPGTATTTGVIGIQTESFTGNGTGTTTIFMPVDMRTSATITIYNPNSSNSTGAVGKVGGGSQSVNAPGSSHRAFYFSLTAASSNSQYYAHYTASAEL